MRILVTGGAGFIGSNIVDKYVASGHTVAIVDNLSSGKKENINQDAKFYHQDITDPSLAKVFEDFRPEIVNHHAAQVDVRKSVEDPVFDTKVNVLGCVNILKCARASGAKRIIFASSGGVIYGETSNRPPAEESPANPVSPYGVAKLASEYYIKCYNAIHGINYAILRYGNVYGLRQDPYGEAGVVAIFGRKMLKNEQLEIYGDGEQERDFVYVRDVAEVNLICLGRTDNLVLNVGTGDTASVNKLFAQMKKLTAYEHEPVYKPERPGELKKSSLDVGRIHHTLGWKHSYSLNNGLGDYLEWLRKTISK